MLVTILTLFFPTFALAGLGLVFIGSIVTAKAVM
jgi:hypothetical protein